MGCFPKEFPWMVYAAHTLSTWGDNMWWFAGGLYMIKIDEKDSLQLTAIYGLVLAATVILFGAAIGNWIDKTRRLTAAKTFLAIQNVCVAICAASASLYLRSRQGNENEDWDDVKKRLVIATVIIISAIARLASTGTVIIIQKDWIVVISEEDNDRLARMNSILRTIELTTYMLAPILVGQLFTFVGYILTGFFIAGWNIVSVAIEYVLLSVIYHKYPGLGTKGAIDPAGDNNNEVKEEQDSTKFNPATYFKETLNGWKIYFNHPVRNAGIGLALLYMTVLGFDNITYGYVIMQRVPEVALGGMVAVSALVGVLGSVAYPIMRKCLGMNLTGFVGMFMLVSMSSFSVASVFVPSSPFWDNFDDPKFDEFKENSFTSIIILLVGIITARFGLWIVDLSITQILQENVEEEHRGIVNGVQDSLNNTLDLVKCCLVIVFYQPKVFGILILLSFASISTGWLSYSIYYCKQPKESNVNDVKSSEEATSLVATDDKASRLERVEFV